uniref:Uncharacterized protein n=1 Tax=Schizaphis graminum TaxID=13262 RepID=A0A2S2NPK3_SCHGA
MTAEPHWAYNQFGGFPSFNSLNTVTCKLCEPLFPCYLQYLNLLYSSECYYNCSYICSRYLTCVTILSYASIIIKQRDFEYLIYLFISIILYHLCLTTQTVTLRPPCSTDDSVSVSEKQC